MTRHWIEAYVDWSDILGRVVCEHPTDCQETHPDQRADGCAIVEWAEAASVPDLLHWPPGDNPVFGHLLVGVEWAGVGEDPELTLVKPTAATAEGGAS